MKIVCYYTVLLILGMNFLTYPMAQREDQASFQDGKTQKEVLKDLASVLKVTPDDLMAALGVGLSKKPIMSIDTLPVEQQASTKALINTRLSDSDYDTLLLKFVKQEPISQLTSQVLRNFLALGADINLKDRLKTAPLHFIVCNRTSAR